MIITVKPVCHSQSETCTCPEHPVDVSDIIKDEHQKDVPLGGPSCRRSILTLNIDS